MVCLLRIFKHAEIDNDTNFCQAANMIHLSRKFVAVLLAIWLPLFSGNVLAAAITMHPLNGHSMNGDCHVAAHTEVSNSTIQNLGISNYGHHDASTHQHVQLAHHQLHQTQQHDQQHAAHNDCGMCQLACCGYLATAETEIAEVPPLAQLFTPHATQFQSVTSAPLDPPPLARV